MKIALVLILLCQSGCIAVHVDNSPYATVTIRATTSTMTTAPITVPVSALP